MENRKPDKNKGLSKEDVARIAAEEGARDGIEAYKRAEQH